MAKEIKIAVRMDAGEPPYLWHVLILTLANDEAQKFLNESQYAHMADQIRELAREKDPSHPLTQRVEAVEEFFELKDKGGPLGKINVRLFFVIDKKIRAIVVLGAFHKQNNGPTPEVVKKRMARRARKYFAGDYDNPFRNRSLS